MTIDGENMVGTDLERVTCRQLSIVARELFKLSHATCEDRGRGDSGAVNQETVGRKGLQGCFLRHTSIHIACGIAECFKLLAAEVCAQVQPGSVSLPPCAASTNG